MNASAPNFDRVARIYRWAEYAALGPLLQRTRTHFLPQLRDRREALVLGDGDGRFLARLLRDHPALHATAIDASAKMLRLLSHRCAFAGDRLSTQQQRFPLIEIATPPDLVVTHFVLDCLSQADTATLAQHIAQHTAPGALWLVSDFARPRGLVRGLLGAAYIRALYSAFRMLTGLRTQRLPDVARALTLAGFTRIARHEKLSGLLYTELWQRGYNQSGMSLADESTRPQPHDAQPDPEPAAPSLPEPDPGVFHHEPGTKQQEAAE